MSSCCSVCVTPREGGPCLLPTGSCSSYYLEGSEKCWGSWRGAEGAEAENLAGKLLLVLCCLDVLTPQGFAVRDRLKAPGSPLRSTRLPPCGSWWDVYFVFSSVYAGRSTCRALMGSRLLFSPVWSETCPRAGRRGLQGGWVPCVHVASRARQVSHSQV